MASTANRVDRLISIFSPKAAFERLKYRKAFEIALSFDGASRGRRTDGWRSVSSASANAELRPALSLLRDRSRDLARNDPYALRAISQVAGHMVGPGIVPTFVCADEKRKKEFSDLWKRWAENDVLADFDEEMNVYGLQGLVARTVAESGECLVLRQWSQDPCLKIPLQLQVIEPDFIDDSKDDGRRMPGNAFDCMGIHFDARRKKTAYWLYEDHPGDNGVLGPSRQVAAKDVLHVFRRDRAGQIRGMPWLAPCILKLRDFSDYEDAQLLRQKIAACFAAFISDPDNEGSSKDMESYFKIEPGRIEDIGNKTITFSDPPTPENYDAYTKRVLHGLSAGFGITYEMLSNDYEKVNFSSARMAKNDFFVNLDVWQWQMYVPKFLMPLGRWFLDACALSGYDTDGVFIDWVPPRRMLVDATREIPAMVSETRAGFKSRSQQIRELGYDPEEVEQEIAGENQRADEMGLVFTTDARKTSNGGQAQTKPLYDDDTDEGGGRGETEE